jgi:hypothetical protein
MWVLLGGTFYTGGLVAGGPFKNEIEADAAMDAVKEMYDLGNCPEFWWFKLTKPMTDDYARDGNAIVFDRDLTRPIWRFFGPFKSIDAARKWASTAGGCAIELKPVPVTEPA